MPLRAVRSLVAPLVVAALPACPAGPGAAPDAGPSTPLDGTYAVDGTLAGEAPPALASGFWAFVGTRVVLFAADFDDTCATYADRAARMVEARSLPPAEQAEAFAAVDAATIPATYWSLRVDLREVEEGAAIEGPLDVRFESKVDVVVTHALDHPDRELLAIGDVAGRNADVFVPAPGTQEQAPGALTGVAVDWEGRASVEGEVAMRAHVNGDGSEFPIALSFDGARCAAVEDALAPDPGALVFLF